MPPNADNNKNELKSNTKYIFDSANKKFLSIFYENIDGISRSKCKELIISSSSADYDIIIFTETWLDGTINNLEFMNANYNVHRKDREYSSSVNLTTGGGVLIAIRKEINCEPYVNELMPELESLCLKIPLSNGSIYIYALYIRYGSNIDLYRRHMNAIKLLNSIIGSHDSLLVLGDFNLSKVEWSENDSGFDYIPIIGDSQRDRAIIAREVTELLSNIGLSQMCNFKNTSSNVLDLVYTNSPELTIVCAPDFLMLPSDRSDSDHVPILCTVECIPTIHSTPGESPQIYCFRRADYDGLREHLSGYKIDNDCGDVNLMVELFYQFLYSAFDTFVPKSSIRSNNRPVWHDKHLHHLKNVRNRLYKKLCSDRLRGVADDRLFMNARNEYEKYRIDAHSNYIRDQEINFRRDPKRFWKFLNGKRKTNEIPDKIYYKDKCAITDVDKSNIFADFFETVYVKHTGDEELSTFIDQRRVHRSNDIVITDEQVHSVLVNMDLNKGSGHDGISSIFLRECADFLSFPLSKIFSRSFSDGIYPDLFKIGQITPIFKAGRRSDVNNYRGVNVLPNMAKVFERVVYNQLRLIVSPKIASSQHGFLSNRNIETNLLELTNHAHRAFEQNAQLDVFYADISKAFDSVNPALLIRKMANFPLSNAVLKWFCSYLNKRRQYVCIGSSKSRYIEVLSGVGQGTVLGPLLFNIFFNDSDGHMECIFDLNFADDKKIFTIVKSLNDAERLQCAINNFMKWCELNNLNVNGSKCKIITFTHKRSKIQFNYQMDDDVITRTKEIRDLGILMDEKLSFNRHIEFVTKKTQSVLHFVKRQSVYFNIDIIKILYMSLVRSNLEFASTVWSPYHAVHRKTIESVQKQFLISFRGDNLNRSDNNFVLRPYIDRCTESGLNTLIRRRINASVLFIHSLIIGKFKSPVLREHMDLNTGIRTLRNPEFIRLKYCRTEHSTYSSMNNACRTFNHAALFIDPSLPHDQFRSKLLKLPDSIFGPWIKLN